MRVTGRSGVSEINLISLLHKPPFFSNDGSLSSTRTTKPPQPSLSNVQFNGEPPSLAFRRRFSAVLLSLDVLFSDVSKILLSWKVCADMCLLLCFP